MKHEKENNTECAGKDADLAVEVLTCEFECVATVRIKINEGLFEVKPGRYRGREIKEIAQLPPAYELEVLNGKILVPVPDERIVKVKGCEKFVGFPCRGKSS